MKHSPSPGVSRASGFGHRGLARSDWRKRAILAGAIAALSTSPAMAITDIWDGSAGVNWSTSANWSTDPAVVPGTSDFATFNLSAAAVNNNTTIDLGTGVTIGSVFFEGFDAAAYTIGSGVAGSQALTVNDSGMIASNFAVVTDQTINASLILGTASTAAYTVSNDGFSNRLIFAGGVQGGTGDSAGAKTLTVGGSGSTVISGPIANGGASSLSILKTAGGTLTLSGNNTFTGGVTIGDAATPGGGLNINSATALGTGTFTISGFSGAVLDNTSGATVTLTSNNAQVWNGNFTFTGTHDLNLGSGNVALGASRSITANGGTFTVGGRISGPGASGLTKLGTGTMILGGLSVYTGATNVSGGTLRAGAASVAGVGGAFGLNSALTIAEFPDAILDLAGFDTHIGSLAGGGTSGGNVLLGSGTLSTGGNSTNTAYGGIISGSGGLTKLGTGTQTLSGANTYSGATTLSGGTLALNFSGTNTGATRLNPASPLVLNGGTLSVLGTEITGQSSIQAVNGVTVLPGQSGIVNSSGAGDVSSTVNLGAISRTTRGGTVNFVLPVNGSITTTTGNTNGILGGWATVDGNTWATATGAIGGLTSYETNYAASNPSNFDVTANGTFSASQINSLRFNTPGGIVTTLSGATVIDSGGILVTGAMGGNASAILGGTSLTSGNGQDLIVIQNNTAGALTIGSNIVGTGIGLTKSGAGTLILSGTNSFTGTTTINTGILNLGSTDALDGDGDITFGGGTLQFSAGNTTDYADRIVNSTAAIRLDTNGSNVTFAGNLASSNTGGMLKSGNGALTLSGNNSFTGSFMIIGGSVNLNSPGALGNAVFNIGNGSIGGSIDNTSGSPVVLTNNNPVNVNNSFTFTGSNSLHLGNGPVTIGIGKSITVAANALTLGGAISGPNGFSKAGQGTLTLSGNNTYTGQTTINNNGGNLLVTSSNALGTGTLHFAKSGTGTGTLQLSGGVTLPNNITGASSNLVTAGGTANVQNISGHNRLTGNINITTTGGAGIHFRSDAGLLELAGQISNPQANRTINFFGDGDGLVSGSIVANAGILVVQKEGNGTWTFSGSNSYTGGTQVNGGTLLVNGSHTSGGAYAVGPLGTLGGVGTIGAESLSVSFGGKLSPGSEGDVAIGEQRFSLTTSMSLASVATGSLLFDLGTPLFSDRIAVDFGTLDIGVLDFEDFVFSTFAGFGNGTYTLLDASSPIFGSIGQAVGTINGLNATLSIDEVKNDVLLQVVPEPNTATMLLGAAALLATRRRRRAA